MRKIKQRAKQRRRQLNNATITFGIKKLRGKELQSVDKKGRVITKYFARGSDIISRENWNKPLYKGELL